MKKTLLAIAAAFSILAISCQKENGKAETVTVNFVAEVPAGISTRAYSDGYTATNLYYAVYAEDKTEVLMQGEKVFSNLRTSVELTLVVGKKYDIIFWAQNPSAPYTFDMAAQTVTANYNGVKANNETLDAFYTTVDSYHVSGPVEETIVLRRPFAQINVGTSDEYLAAISLVNVEQSTMTVSGISNVLNLKTGEVSGDEAAITFELSDIPSGENDKITIKGEEYGYMEMNYVLVAADKELKNISFALKTNEHTIDYSLTNVPVQRNYRTNIYGALLTNPTVWNVEIDPVYKEPSYDEPID